MKMKYKQIGMNLTMSIKEMKYVCWDYFLLFVEQNSLKVFMIDNKQCPRVDYIF